MGEHLDRLEAAAMQGLKELRKWHADDPQTSKLELIEDYIIALKGGPVRELPDPDAPAPALPLSDFETDSTMMTTRNAFNSGVEPKALPEDTPTEFGELTAEEFEESPGALDEVDAGEVTDTETEGQPKSAKRKTKG